jgi:MFS family permease
LILAHLQPLPLLVFYLMTVFTLSWATSDLGYSKGFSINAVVFGIVFRVFIPVSALIADRIGRRKCLLCHNGHRFFWFCLFFFLNSGSPVLVTLLCIGMALMGFTYGPLGTFLSELFPTNIRYSGTSLAFNMAGIIGQLLRL